MTRGQHVAPACSRPPGHAPGHVRLPRHTAAATGTHRLATWPRHSGDPFGTRSALEDTERWRSSSWALGSHHHGSPDTRLVLRAGGGHGGPGRPPEDWSVGRLGPGTLQPPAPPGSPGHQASQPCGGSAADALAPPFGWLQETLARLVTAQHTESGRELGTGGRPAGPSPCGSSSLSPPLPGDGLEWGGPRDPMQVPPRVPHPTPVENRRIRPQKTVEAKSLSLTRSPLGPRKPSGPLSPLSP